MQVYGNENEPNSSGSFAAFIAAVLVLLFAVIGVGGALLWVTIGH